MTRVRVIGAGPAGTAAAISALRHGAAVDLYEKSRFPRHKVCGEFLSPGATHILDRLGVDWQSLQPAPLRRLLLCFDNRQSLGDLPETAFGLSRYALDALLLQRALAGGAVLHRTPGESDGAPCVIATGRHCAAPKGSRLFGFKAHFEGPYSDTMELHFQRKGAYVGVNAIERGRTNVCGLAPEDALAAHRFEIDAYLASIPSLQRRLDGMRRLWGWIRVGPLVFENQLNNSTDFGKYYAGDSLFFIDPFTGSGMLTALLTGELAGEAAALGQSSEEYVKKCKQLLTRPQFASRVFRLSIKSGLAEFAERLIPHRWLFRLTRPRIPVTHCK